MKTFCLEVAGDFACFTRPEMKVERVSYDVITPSAARAVFEAILWKPAIRWHVTKIEVLKPVRWISVRRNEVGAVAIIGKAEIFADDASMREQRAGLLLCDVAYRMHAHFELRDPSSHKSNYPHLSKRKTTQGEDDLAALPDNNAAKFMSMFERRAQKGQCVNQPYLGCREFSARFELVAGRDGEPPIQDSRDLGWMLYDLNYGEEITPRFFRAEMKNGVIVVPAWDSEEVRG